MTGRHEATISQCEQCASGATRLQQTRVWLWVYVVILALCLVLITLAVVQHNVTSTAFVSLDIFVNMLIIFEVAVRMVSQGVKRFFATWVNKLDAFFAAVCVLTLFVYVIDEGKPDSFEEVFTSLSTIVLLIRTVFQMCRLAFLLYSEHARRQRTKEISLLPNNDSQDLLEDDDDEEEMLRELNSVQRSSGALGNDAFA